MSPVHRSIYLVSHSRRRAARSQPQIGDGAVRHATKWRLTHSLTQSPTLPWFQDWGNSLLQQQQQRQRRLRTSLPSLCSRAELAILVITPISPGKTFPLSHRALEGWDPERVCLHPSSEEHLMKAVPEACTGVAPWNERFRLQWRVSSEQYSAQVFSNTMYSFVQYPERSSTVILRADILEDRPVGDHMAIQGGPLPVVSGWSLTRMLKRRILPRNPRIDRDMLQKCYFYKTEGDANQVLVLFEPCDKQNIPFYHPQVEALVFHYNSKHLTISYIPLDNQDQHSDDDDTGTRQRINRLERTMFQLAIIISKHSSGNMKYYQKRVEHDLVVAKHDWQDLYTELKGRYASEYVSKWVECTDPRKHVFEDLGIASFLINLRLQIAESLGSQRPVTFVDLGCGNGLLVEILMREGIETSGFDARRRKSWDVYTAATQAVLQEMVLYPEMLSTEQGAERSDSALKTMATMVELNYGLFDRNQFLIGNHADELTPYIPLLAALSSCSNDVELGPDVIPTAGFLIIPCCTHTFSGEKHNGLSTKGGRYASYIAWLIDICEEVGWVVERESLRIPSTRNCAIICRHRKLVENSADSADPDSVGHPGKQTPRDRLVNLCRGIITRNGGMDDFLERSRSLTSTKPRTH